MLTIFFAFFLFVLIIPLGMAAQRWLFKDANELYDPEWELYQQRYD